MKFAAFLFAVVMVVSSAFAVVPTTMTYQAIFTDLEGNVMPDGVYEIGFHIFSSAIGGPPVWSEWQDVTVTDGVFEVTLGVIFALNFTDFLDPEGDGQWLSLEYNDTWMHPRQFISSVPYAFIACLSDSTRKLGDFNGDSLSNVINLYDDRLDVHENTLDTHEACIDTLKDQIDSVRAGQIGIGSGMTLRSSRTSDDDASIELPEDQETLVNENFFVDLIVPSAMVITAAAHVDNDIEACDASSYEVRIGVLDEEEGIVFRSILFVVDGGSDIMLSAITPLLEPGEYQIALMVQAEGGDCEILEYDVAATFQGPEEQPIMRSSSHKAQPRR